MIVSDKYESYKQTHRNKPYLTKPKLNTTKKENEQNPTLAVAKYTAFDFFSFRELKFKSVDVAFFLCLGCSTTFCFPEAGQYLARNE